MKVLLAVFVLAGASVQSQMITQNFGTGANQFSIDFVSIGNAGNSSYNGIDFVGKSYSAGAVSYSFYLGKFEISRDVMIKASLSGATGYNLADMTSQGGNGLNRPATGISWTEAARFVNWLNTSSGYQSAYKFDSNGNLQLWTASDSGYNPNNLFRNSLAKFVIPNADEWFKGAYNSTSGQWFKYTTGSNTAPTSVFNGTSAGTAVYLKGANNGPADIDKAGGLSPWGTMGQGGNVGEWIETASDGLNDDPNESRIWRGGTWFDADYYLDRDHYYGFTPEITNTPFGLRVAMVPEPSVISLLALGGLALAINKRRRG
jgi:hypothetical protein